MLRSVVGSEMLIRDRVLVFGEGVVMVYCMVWCGWEVDINCSKEE